MTEYTITMAKKRDIENYYEGSNSYFKTIEVEVEANNTEEAIEMVKGYKGMVAWKVDGTEVWG